MPDQFEDQNLECIDCQQAFVFTAGEQQFFAKQNPPFNPPKRCKPCRDAKKQSKQNAGGGRFESHGNR